MEWTPYPFIPNLPGRDQLPFLLSFIAPFDFVVLQRCYIYEFAAKIKKVCEFLGKPLVFETDDDYLNLPPDNPAYWGMLPDKVYRSGSDVEKEYFRRKGLEEYKQLISEMDLITVSTEELKRTLNPYNKNIEVLPNNVERIWTANSHDIEQVDPNNPGIIIPPKEKHGLVTIPDHYRNPDGRYYPVVRLGYSGTPSHEGLDFKTIKYYWEKVIEKYSKPNKANKQQLWFVYLGSEYFYEHHAGVVKSKGLQKRNFFIRPSPYDLYMFNLRNLDIGIAPLMPNVFNMAKSDIKPTELAAWAIPSLLPHYITYTRNWKDGVNCLTYLNGQEFVEKLDLLVNDPELRFKLGKAAQEYVRDNRLEHQHSAKRFSIYEKLVSNSYPLKIFSPDKQEVLTA